MNEFQFRPCDLRVGSQVNYVTTEYKGLCTIDEQDILLLCTNPDRFNEVHEPIPLTHAILESISDGINHDENDFPVSYRIKSILILYFHGQFKESGLHEIKYWHQLQDLHLLRKGEMLLLK